MMNLITTDWTVHGEITDTLHHPVSHTAIIRDSYRDCMADWGSPLKQNKNKHAFNIIHASIWPKEIKRIDNGFKVNGFIHVYKQNIDVLLHDAKYLGKFNRFLRSKFSETTKIYNSTPLHVLVSELFSEIELEYDKIEFYRFKKIKKTTCYELSLPEDVKPPYHLPITTLYQHVNGQTRFFLEDKVIHEKERAGYAKTEFQFSNEMEFIFGPIKVEVERRIKSFVNSNEYKQLE